MEYDWTAPPVIRAFIAASTLSSISCFVAIVRSFKPNKKAHTSLVDEMQAFYCYWEHDSDQLSRFENF